MLIGAVDMALDLISVVAGGCTWGGKPKYDAEASLHATRILVYQIQQ
jgi:hypothetical protein